MRLLPQTAIDTNRRSCVGGARCEGYGPTVAYKRLESPLIRIWAKQCGVLPGGRFNVTRNAGVNIVIPAVDAFLLTS